jgi:hypothetical protein
MRRGRSFWLLPALLIAAPATAQKRIDPGSWYDPLDLSRDLLAQVGNGGQLVMDVEVGADGQPKRCDVSVSSGIADLDALSCRLTMRRARWEPKRDDAGIAVAASTRVAINWRLLTPPQPPALTLAPRVQRLLTSKFTYQRMGMPGKGSVTLDVALAVDGTSTACRVRAGGSSGSEQFDTWLCQRTLAARPLAVIDYRGAVPAPLRTTVHVSWTIEPGSERFISLIDVETSS